MGSAHDEREIQFAYQQNAGRTANRRLAMAPGTFSGRGRLSPGDFSVEYELIREVVNRPKTSQHPAFVSWYSTIRIRSGDERAIPPGIYELTLEDGTIERVKNHGLEWTVLNPLPT
jgi:hypothetical protein